MRYTHFVLIHPAFFDEGSLVSIAFSGYFHCISFSCGHTSAHILTNLFLSGEHVVVASGIHCVLFLSSLCSTLQWLEHLERESLPMLHKSLEAGEKLVWRGRSDKKRARPPPKDSFVEGEEVGAGGPSAAAASAE